MNTKQIEYFLSVAGSLNISHSAQILYASQSTVSRQISLLEEELGFELFVRGHNYLRLTPAGAVMCRAFRELGQIYEGRFREALRMNEGYEGALRFGFYSNMRVEYFLSDVIASFQRQYPNIRLEFECISDDLLDTYIRTNQYDLTFLHHFDEIDCPDFLTEQVCETRRFLLYGAAHRLADKPGLSFPDFRDEIFWSVKNRDTQAREDDIASIFRHYGIERWRMEEAPNFSTVLLNVQLGNGVIFLDPITTLADSAYYRMLELPEEIARVGISVTWNRNNLNPAIPLFVNQFIRMPP